MDQRRADRCGGLFTGEFDITDLRFDGENTIAVKVFRWCDGSWLEDQDYFDLSGIFRDVYVYAAPQVRVRDYSIVTDFDDTFTDSALLLAADVTNHTGEAQPIEISLALLSADGSPVALEGTTLSATIPAGQEKTLHFSVDVPRRASGARRIPICIRWCWRKGRGRHGVRVRAGGLSKNHL